MYHVIAPPPAGAPFPGLYVPPAEFSEQMAALKRAGWHAVTLEELHENWTKGTPLPGGKPVVITFDNGYQSQYTRALPVLRSLGWTAVENVQLQGLPPSQGGFYPGQIEGLIHAGWELDTQGISHADLTTLSGPELAYQVATARRTLQRRYHVPVNWFCYPSGHYDQAVVEEVRSAGFIGSTTVIPGWAHRNEDPYRMHRLRVLGGTSGSALLGLIDGTRDEPPGAADLHRGLISRTLRLTAFARRCYRRRLRPDGRTVSGGGPLHIDPYIVLGSAVVGLLVGMTGAGGGALMTPMLILLFSVTPSKAISSDLVAAVVMRPVGAAVHFRRGTVNFGLVKWMVIGSVPMAFLGTYLLHVMGHTKTSEKNIEVILGIALLVGAGAMVVRGMLDSRTGERRTQSVTDLVVRPIPTLIIGIIGGVMVGLTSVGSGSLMIVMLLFLYPLIGAGQLVGTDLTQAVPLTAAAALRRADLRQSRIRRDAFADPRLCAGRVRRRALLLQRAGPLYPAGHHVRDLRVGAEVRRPRHGGSRLGARCDLAGGLRALAVDRPALGQRRAARSGRRTRRLGDSQSAGRQSSSCSPRASARVATPDRRAASSKRETASTTGSYTPATS